MKTLKQKFLLILFLIGIFLSPLRAQEKYGFIDKQGQITIPIDYDYCGDFSDGLAVFEKNGKMGYLDKNGKEVIKAQFDYCKSFHEGLASLEPTENMDILTKLEIL